MPERKLGRLCNNSNNNEKRQRSSNITDYKRVLVRPSFVDFDVLLCYAKHQSVNNIPYRVHSTLIVTVTAKVFPAVVEDLKCCSDDS